MWACLLQGTNLRDHLDTGDSAKIDTSSICAGLLCTGSYLELRANYMHFKKKILAFSWWEREVQITANTEAMHAKGVHNHYHLVVSICWEDALVWRNK